MQTSSHDEADRSPSTEERIGDLAARQHGVVTRGQLLEVGVSSAAIGRRLNSGRLRPCHKGVYRVGPLEPDRAVEMAAVLAGGPAATLSHTSALHLWKMLRDDPPRPVHITVPGGGRSRRSGIHFHRVGSLAPDEHTVVDGIRLTTPARTIADVAGILGSREVEQAVSAAEREGLVGSEELGRLPDRYRSRPGMAMLRSLLAEATGAHFTRSEAERRCLELLRAGGLPRPHTNVRIGPYELDLFWPKENVAVEIDGRKHHASGPHFEGDRRKDAWLRSRGVAVVRLTWSQITRKPTATAVQVGQVLALARTQRLATAEQSGGSRAGPSRAESTDLRIEGSQPGQPPSEAEESRRARSQTGSNRANSRFGAR